MYFKRTSSCPSLSQIKLFAEIHWIISQLTIENSFYITESIEENKLTPLIRIGQYN